MHLDAETIERVLHRELDPAREAAASEHLSSCAACGARMEEARSRERRVFGLLESLDHEPPGVDWAAVESPAAPKRTGALLAASIAGVLVAGILYALPGSPVRQWVEGLTGTGEGTSGSQAPPAPASQPVSGLSVRPTGPFEIVFVADQVSGVIRVEFGSGPEVEIRVVGPPVELASEPDRVTVANRDSRSSYEIRLPGSGPPITVRVGQAVVLTGSGDDVRTSAPRGASGDYRIDLGRPDP